jgi:hypothetical protein
MKKTLLGIAGVLILALVVVLFVNARNEPKEEKKTVTTKESSMDCGKCETSASAACASKGETSEPTAATTETEAKPAGSCCSKVTN